MGFIAFVSNKLGIYACSFVCLRVKQKQLIENFEKFENHPHMLVV